MESFKYPQTYILLGAPFRLLMEGKGSGEVLRQGALQLLGPVLSEHAMLREISQDRMSDIVELDSVLRIELESKHHGRSAMLIWIRDQSLIRVEALLHNAQDVLAKYDIKHILCFIRPTNWNELKSSARAFLGSERTGVIHAPAGSVEKGLGAILAVRSCPGYSDRDKRVFAEYLKGEYPLAQARPRARSKARDGEITIEFVVAEVAPDLLKGE